MLIFFFPSMLILKLQLITSYLFKVLLPESKWQAERGKID